MDSVFELYPKSKTRLMEAGFKLRKFVTNSSELRHLISRCEQRKSNPSTDNDVQTSREDDQSYAKNTLGTRSDVIEEPESHRILGVQWEVDRDLLSFNIREIHQFSDTIQPTKRNVVSMSSRFYDPMGIMSPVTVQFKIFFQHLCKVKIEWDEVLTGDLLKMWKKTL